MLERFADVPDTVPDYNDTNTFSKYAVKKLLRALLNDWDNGGSRGPGISWKASAFR
jgi:hypothetical protein